MSRVVAESTRLILHIWQNKDRIGDLVARRSALDLVGESEQLPYDMPLGDRSPDGG